MRHKTSRHNLVVGKHPSTELRQCYMIYYTNILLSLLSYQQTIGQWVEQFLLMACYFDKQSNCEERVMEDSFL